MKNIKDMKDEQLPGLESRIKIYHDASGKVELLGFADLVVAGTFVIRGIRILRTKPTKDGQQEGELFLSFPSRKFKGTDGDKYIDVACPITSEAYQSAREAILRAYEKAAHAA